MQPIERYGLITLLFLVVSAVAFAMWDAEGQPEDRVGAALPEAAGSKLAAAPEQAKERPRTQQAGLGAAGARNPGKPAGNSRALNQAPPTTPKQDPEVAQWRREERDAEAAARSEDLWSEAGREADYQNALNPRRNTTREPEQPAPQPEPEVDPEPAPEAIGGGALSSTVTPRVEPGLETYVVQSGDTLGELAQKFCGTVHAQGLIRAANPKLGEFLIAGKSINLPSQKSVRDFQLAREAKRGSSDPVAVEPGPAQTPETPAPAAGQRTYTVRNGESLWTIAARELGDGNAYKQILALNPTVNADRISPGLVLVMPGGSAPVANNAPATAPATEDSPYRVR